MKWLLAALLILTPFYLKAYETIVESDEAHYNGETITLSGHVRVQNDMGTVCAKRATLCKDEKKQTKIDFPWIELHHDVTLTLSGGGKLRCEALYFDYTQMTGSVVGKPQLTYTDTFGEVYADRATIDYVEVDGKLEAKEVTLYDNVRLVNLGNSEKPASQYALADEVHFFPQEQLTVMEGKQNRVLFFDKERDMQLSARSVRAQRDPVTKKETVQGMGDVRFVFGPEELEKIKGKFVP